MPFDTLVPNVGKEIVAAVDGARLPEGLLAVWVAPRAAESLVRRLGGTPERTVLLRGDDSATVKGVKITSLPSSHYGFFSEERYTAEEEAYYATIPAQLPPERPGTERFL